MLSLKNFLRSGFLYLAYFKQENLTELQGNFFLSDIFLKNDFLNITHEKYQNFMQNYGPTSIH